MLGKLKTLISNPAVSNSAMVTASVFISSVFGYLLQFSLGRLLSVSDYGTFNALFAVMNILTVPGLVLSTSLIKLISEHKVYNEFDKLTHLYYKLSLILFGTGVFISTVIFFGRFYLSSLLNITDASVIAAFGVYLSFIFVSIIPSAYLQGLSKFKVYSIANIVTGCIKFTVPITLVLLGLHLHGAFLGLFLFSASSYLLGTLLLRGSFKAFSKESLSPLFRKLITFSLSVLMVNLGMSFLQNIDLIFVKSLFPAVEAGYYAGVVTVGKVFLYGAGTICVVMFPQIAEAFAKKEDYTQKFKTFFLLQLTVVLCGIAAFSLAPKFITVVLFGEKFLPVVNYLPLLSVFIGLYVLLNFMMMYFLAIGKTKVFVLQIPGVVLQIILISLFHETLYQIIWDNILSVSLVFVSISGYYFSRLKFKKLL
ncbi:MAG: capsular polysaccharide biosynthesis protein [uncultured bacterium]|nr:MAG: capsular polysaccharide biosynthesis protein [uncultured bacterium]